MVALKFEIVSGLKVDPEPLARAEEPSRAGRLTAQCRPSFRVLVAGDEESRIDDLLIVPSHITIVLVI